MTISSDRIPSAGLLGRYLKAFGWQATKLRVSELELYTKMLGSQSVELIIPKHGKVPNAADRIKLAVDTLAIIEDRTPSAVSTSVENIGFDLTRERINSQLYDSVRLSVAERMVTKSRELMLEAARIEFSVGSAKNPNTIASKFINQCRFGHTFRGSFGFTIKSPTGTSVRFDDDSLSELVSSERLIVQRIIRGVSLFAKPMSDEDASLIRSPAVGFSPEMLEDLASLLEGSRSSSVSFDFELSPEMAHDDDIVAKSSIEVPISAASVAKDIASDMRRRDHPSDTVLTGLVAKLATSENPADLENVDGTYEVTLGWERGGKIIAVKVLLKPLDYRSAYEAHGSYRKITVEGKLERAGRGYVLRGAKLLKGVLG